MQSVAECLIVLGLTLPLICRLRMLLIDKTTLPDQLCYVVFVFFNVFSSPAWLLSGVTDTVGMTHSLSSELLMKSPYLQMQELKGVLY